MARPEWGTKRDCQHCGARFYDLNKDPAYCPKCGTEYRAHATTKVSHAPAPQPKAPPPPPVVKTEGAEEVEEEIAVEDEEEDIIEDEELIDEEEAEVFETPPEEEK